MRQIIPLPESVRQVISSFALLDGEQGPQSIAQQIDFSGATRRQIIAITSGRLPGSKHLSPDDSPYNAQAAFVRAISSSEFQTRIREIVLSAFPEKRRVINLHIPKCAGTDLEVALRRRYPFLHHTMSIPNATSTSDLFKALRHLALGMHFSDAIAVSGHVPLSWYLHAELVRIQDDVFTTIRPPRQRIYSQISYMLTNMVKFRGTRRHDTTGWLAAIGLTELAHADSAYLVDIGRRLLRSPAIRANEMCHILGSGTAETAIENLALADVEITDTDRYSAWRTEKLGFAGANRVNASQPLFTEELANEDDRHFIESLIRQDVTLYDTVRRHLDLAGLLSVRGRFLT